jgi:hypothetical protein
MHVINLNDQVTFRLTLDGAAVANKYERIHFEERIRRMWYTETSYTMPLWELASILGAAMYNGGSQLIVDNRLEYRKM